MGTNAGSDTGADTSGNTNLVYEPKVVTEQTTEVESIARPSG